MAKLTVHLDTHTVTIEAAVPRDRAAEIATRGFANPDGTVWYPPHRVNAITFDAPTPAGYPGEAAISRPKKTRLKK